MTELEGAILGVLRRSPGLSPYAVRREFQTSSSAEWSASAGAIYPAIARLKGRGMLISVAGGDKRGMRRYTLTKKGRAAHDEWLCDISRIIGPGVDPFRTRAALWLELPVRRRESLLRVLKSAIVNHQAQMSEQEPVLDRGDAITLRLYIGLQEQRLLWLETGGAAAK